ncbi:MAG: CoA transferase [Gammaproteobacteria bacterium]|nr:CoA transferase [Gammaproteobacteria bacterium]
MTTKPLRGIRVLDLTHMLSGPYAAMLLADLGAETIKVEPLQGEGTRKLLADDPENAIDGMGAYFITLNRNKKSTAIDLKHEAGREVFYDLVRIVDVVISNFAAGVPERLGIDYATLVEINPKIITCSISGFGSAGPNYRRPAFDMVAQAIGGGMSITGLDADHPVRSGIPHGDLCGGMFGAMGVLTALIERGVSGQGQHVDISMQDCQLSLLNYMATMHFLSGQNPTPLGNAHFVHVPYDTFRCRDGFIVIAVITDGFWQNLKKVVQINEFEDSTLDLQPGRLANQAMINAKLNERLSGDTVANWLQQLEEHRIPCAPVNKFSQALTDPQALHRNMIVELKHPSGQSTKGPGNPIKLSRTECESFDPAPLLGQHTDEVLTELLDYNPTRVNQLRSEGIVA